MYFYQKIQKSKNVVYSLTQNTARSREYAIVCDMSRIGGKHEVFVATIDRKTKKVTMLDDAGVDIRIINDIAKTI